MTHPTHEAPTSMFVLVLSAALIALTVSYSVDAEPLDVRSGRAETMLSIAPTAAVWEPPTFAPSAIVLDALPPYQWDDGTLKLYYGPGKTELPLSAERALEDMVHSIQQGQRVMVAGFHDKTGNPHQNTMLSKRRAQAVQKRLMDLGIPAKAIELSKPSVALDTNDHAQARRVEIKLIGTPAAARSAAVTPSTEEVATPFRVEEGMLKLYFAPSKTDISPSVDEALAAVVQAAKNGKQLQISGFHDETGNAPHNLLLS